jgi:hypothetical protein
VAFRLDTASTASYMGCNNNSTTNVLTGTHTIVGQNAF